MTGPRWKTSPGWLTVIWITVMGDALLLLWLKPQSELVAYGVLVGTALAIYIAYKLKR